MNHVSMQNLFPYPLPFLPSELLMQALRDFESCEKMDAYDPHPQATFTQFRYGSSLDGNILVGSTALWLFTHSISLPQKGLSGTNSQKSFKLFLGQQVASHPEMSAKPPRTTSA